ncbi:MAG TPA: hypothetical protein VE954_39310 [Oligoflexus sp.]|uniref:hypothetical protein n=1 Tax=Oligoflexus sp. TaxID=1971216 RepID=UPI002D33BA0E|nr:hypothetical protein [Oligoflexus sp.]HYX39189.1 hypothetical protein [Oligoflexus sp.]
MKPYLRRSIFTKASALGFIVMILLGNAWLVVFLTGQSGAAWLSYSLTACMIWTILAGCGMGFKMIQHQIQKEPDDDAAV